MNTRPLSERESRGLASLNDLGIPSALLFVTATALKKSILDATEPMRRFFERFNVHDYGQQAQGQEHKVSLPGIFLEVDAIRETDVSLYRPRTKQGDPRFWPYGFSQLAEGGDVFAVAFIYEKLHFLNLSRADVADALARRTVLSSYLERAGAARRSIAEELLGLLREVAARGPIRSIGRGDTTIGMTIEHALGIVPNSDRTPDYKGIEIKAARRKNSPGGETRATLFACVPDWDISRFKSSAEILEHFGYQRDSGLRLYCTVSAGKPNSQGLFLKVDDAAQWLKEMAATKPVADVAVWRIPRLENRLAAKHRETFWVKARAEKRNGEEWFHLHSVVHTQNPNLPQLQRLLEDGSITVDHLIKQTASGGAREKGPLFKIERPKIPELFFGTPRAYPLS